MNGNAQEWQFDGLVGPTHNYAGLALGNVASASNAGAVANPRAAALQGLEKMRFVRDLGIPQAVLPPHYRPMLSTLRRLGFTGSRADVLEAAARLAPGLLASVYSSAFMWSANAATVTPAPDSGDGRLHLSVANLMSHFHRSIEAEFTTRSLSRIFSEPAHFCVHPPFPATESFSDEGAANHMRVAVGHSALGTNIFVYGKDSDGAQRPERFPARQHRLAFEAVARLHGLQPDRALYLQQSPTAIDAGVFHNDVIAISTCERMIIHELALVETHRQTLLEHARAHTHWRVREVKDAELNLDEAVRTYFFNSQYLQLPEGRYALIAPKESEENQSVKRLIHALHSEGMLDETHYLEVRESMKNGGGPACLRLRVVLDAKQALAMHQGVVLTDGLYTALTQWVKTHYRERLTLSDLSDPSLIDEVERAYRALEGILNLPELYTPYLETAD